MSDKKLYSKADFDEFTEAIKREYESTLMRQRERIDELKGSLAQAEKKIAEFESQKELLYKAITTALKKADDIERVSLIRYNQEIAQLKSFHDKWVGYFNRIVEKYPLTGELVEASKVNGRIAEVLKKSGDIEAQYESERNRLIQSVAGEATEKETAAVIEKTVKSDDYADRSPAGFSFSEALHPKEDLMDIMRELGVIMDEE